MEILGNRNIMMYCVLVKMQFQQIGKIFTADIRPYNVNFTARVPLDGSFIPQVAVRCLLFSFHWVDTDPVGVVIKKRNKIYRGAKY